MGFGGPKAADGCVVGTLCCGLGTFGTVGGPGGTLKGGPLTGPFDKGGPFICDSLFFMIFCGFKRIFSKI